MTTEQRLDAGESIWFKRQLEYIKTELIEKLVPANLARLYIPTEEGVPDWVNVFTYRQVQRFGVAKIVGHDPDDIPTADATGQEFSKVIKTVASSYRYTIDEIKAAAATNTPLDMQKALSARMAIDNEMDRILAFGDTATGLEGILNLSTVDAALTPTTKTGGAPWATATNTPDQVAADFSKILTTIVGDLQGAGGPMFQKFTALVPIEQYGYLGMTRLGTNSDTTLLDYLLSKFPWLEGIEPWARCNGAGGSGADRMVVYARNPMVVSAVVPREFTPLPPQERNLSYVVNATAKTAGVVARYPVAIRYMDGI
jgi:hypothetical protein